MGPQLRIYEAVRPGFYSALSDTKIKADKKIFLKVIRVFWQNENNALVWGEELFHREGLWWHSSLKQIHLPFGRLGLRRMGEDEMRRWNHRDAPPAVKKFFHSPQTTASYCPDGAIVFSCQ